MAKTVDFEILMRDKTAEGIQSAEKNFTDLQQKIERQKALIVSLETEVKRLQQIKVSPGIDNSADIEKIEQLQNKIKELKTELTSMVTVSGKTKEMIPDPTSTVLKYNGLNMSIQQVARELPTLAMGPQMFFLAISNNLPILSDELQKAKEANEALKASNQTAVPVWKQVVSSIFSWQTALVAGITLLVMFAPKITDFITHLLSGKKAVDDMRLSNEAMNSVIAESSKEAGKQIAQLETYYKTATDANKPLKDRYNAIKYLRAEFPDYFQNISSEIILTGKASNTYQQATKDVLAYARAMAVMGQMQKIETKNIDTTIKLGNVNANLAFYKRLRDTANSMFVGLTGEGAKQGWEKAKEYLKGYGETYQGVIKYIKEAEKDQFMFQQRNNSQNKALQDLKKLYNVSDNAKQDPTIKNYDKSVADQAKAQEEKRKRELEKIQRQEDQANQKRVAASQWLNNKETELANERAQQQQESDQKLLSFQTDSFSRRYDQNEAEYNKSLQQIKTWQVKIAKEQQDAAREEYIKENGTAKGFDFSKLSSKDLEKLPEGLKPEDIKKQVSDMQASVLAAYVLGNNKIGVEQDKFRVEQRLRFAGELDQQIGQINAYYKELLKMAEGDATGTAELNKNKQTEITAATLQYQNRLIQFETQYTERSIELSGRRYLFQADKQKEILEAQIKGQEQLVDNLQKQLNNDPTNTGLAEQLKMAKLELKGFNEELEKTPAEKFAEMANDIQSLVDSLSSTLDDLGVKSDKVKDAMDGISKTAKGATDIASGLASKNPIQVIQGGIEAIGGLAKIADSIFGSNNISEKTLQQYENLMSAINETIDKQKELLETLSGKEAVEASEKSVELTNKQIEATRNLGKAYLNSGSSWRSHSIGYNLHKDLTQYRDDFEKLGIDFDSLGGRMEGLFNLSPEQLEQIKEEIPEAWAKLDDKTKEYLQNIIDSSDTLSDLKDALNESLTGISFDSLKDSLDDLVKNADTTFDDISDSFGDHMKTAVLNMVKSQYITNALKDWYSKFASAMSDNVLSKDEAKELQDMYTSIYTNAKNLYDNALNAAGISNDDSTEQSANGGSFTAMSQEQGTKLEGLFTSGQIHWANIDAGIQNLASMMSASEGYWRTIAENTVFCKKLDTIANDINYMRLNGIKMS